MPVDNSLEPKKITTAGDMSATLSSVAADVRHLDNVSFQFIWSAGASPVGTVTLEGSLNYNKVGETASWVTITLSATLSVSGNTGSMLIDANQTPFPYLRVTYTRTSGSANVDIWVSGKES